jgi:CRISPR system Cascade subunit CasB
MISVANPKRIALARNDFTQFSSPHNKKIIELLDLPKTLDKGHKKTGASEIVMHRTLEPEPDLSFSRPEMRDILISWWKELDSRRGDRAALRQCRTPRDVALTPAFQRLKIRLTSYGSLNQGQMDRLALVAGVLSHVKENKPDAFEKNVKRSCAVQMARPPQKRGRGKNSCVSDLRFRQLLKIEEPDTLYMTMISLVRLLGGSVNIASLAHGISRWNEQTKKEWAYAYYENASREEKQGG